MSSGTSQVLRQASVLFSLVRIVRVGREGFRIRVRIAIVDAPLADIHVVGAGAVLGQRLLAVARDDFDLDAACAGVCWKDSAMPVTGCVLRTSMVTEKPSGRPALASSSLALATSSL